MINYNFTEEQWEIIEAKIKDFLLDNGKLLHFLRKRGQIVDMKDQISPDIHFEQELEHGQIGIKSQNVNFIDSDLKKIAVIKMILKINKRFVDEWVKKKMKRNVIDAFQIFKEIVKFSNQIEQFFLRGIDTEIPFSLVELDGDEDFKSFFCSSSEINEIIINQRGAFHNAVQELKYRLKSANYYPPYILISDSEMKTMAEIGLHYYEIPRKSEKTMIEDDKEIAKWVDFVNGMDSEGNDYKLICIPERNNNTFRVVEKSPLELFQASNGSIVFYWCGALEILKEESVQRIKLI